MRVLNTNFVGANTVVNNPSLRAGGEGPVTGQELVAFLKRL